MDRYSILLDKKLKKEPKKEPKKKAIKQDSQPKRLRTKENGYGLCVVCVHFDWQGRDESCASCYWLSNGDRDNWTPDSP
jgi:hypothetical protein